MRDHSVSNDLQVAETLRELLSTGNVLMLHKEWDGLFTGNLAPSKSARAYTLEACLEELVGQPRTKVCIKEDCDEKGKARGLGAFGRDKDSLDGFCNVCLACDSKRVNGYHLRAREKARARAKS